MVKKERTLLYQKGWSLEKSILSTSVIVVRDMTGARQIFVMRKLITNYGYVGKVAAKYVAAGYSVTVNPPLKGVDFTASKHGIRFAGIIFAEKKTYGVEEIEKVKEIAEKYKVKPLIILYGAGPRITSEALEKAKKYGIIIKRIR